MARRKRTEEEHDNHERWMVSYADFITLLFAFFVIMYALSSLSVGQYRVLSESIVSAFNRIPGVTPGELIKLSPNPPQSIVKPLHQAAIGATKQETTQQSREKMRFATQSMRAYLAPLVEKNLARVTEGPNGVSIELNASTLFSAGGAKLDPSAAQLMGSIGQILAPTNFLVTIEGHTDNQPISSAQFPSNWELSSSRSAAVARVFVDSGMDSRRLTASGFADQRPADDNATPEGRARNRRVVLNIAVAGVNP
jgi:chemotaxis protein MotB